MHLQAEFQGLYNRGDPTTARVGLLFVGTRQLREYHFKCGEGLNSRGNAVFRRYNYTGVGSDTSMLKASCANRFEHLPGGREDSEEVRMRACLIRKPGRERGELLFQEMRRTARHDSRKVQRRLKAFVFLAHALQEFMNYQETVTKEDARKNCRRAGQKQKRCRPKSAMRQGRPIGSSRRAKSS